MVRRETRHWTTLDDSRSAPVQAVSPAAAAAAGASQWEGRRWKNKTEPTAHDGEVNVRLDAPSILVTAAIDFLLSLGEDILEVVWGEVFWGGRVAVAVAAIMGGDVGVAVVVVVVV
jgi:hypothetical protein